jgi:DNA replication protein DnaC
MFYFGLHWSEQVRVAPAIVLTDEQERELTRLARSKRTSVRLAQRARIDLLLLDDLGGVPLHTDERTDLLELLDDRVGVKATLITSQLAVNAWHAWIDEPTVADAILDRLVHTAHRIELKGPSLRKPESAAT